MTVLTFGEVRGLLKAGCKLTPEAGEAVVRSLDVLQRVADNDCTNAQKEARDILSQLNS